MKTNLVESEHFSIRIFDSHNSPEISYQSIARVFMGYTVIEH